MYYRPQSCVFTSIGFVTLYVTSDFLPFTYKFKVLKVSCFYKFQVKFIFFKLQSKKYSVSSVILSGILSVFILQYGENQFYLKIART